MNNYPAWMLLKENGKRKKNLGETQGRDEAILTSGKRRIPVKILYIRGLSAQIRKLYKNYNIPTYMYYKHFNTLHQQLVRPKDPVPKERVVGPIYHVSCEDCGKDYIGETERSFKARFDEPQLGFPAISTKKTPATQLVWRDPGYWGWNKDGFNEGWRNQSLFMRWSQVSIEMARDSICPPSGTTLWVRGLERGCIHRVPRS